MRARVGEWLAVLLLSFGCGRTGLELDDEGGSGAGGVGAAGSGGVSVVAGTGGAGGGIAGESSFCPFPSFSANLPDDGSEGVSTYETVSVGFVCPEPKAIDPSTLSLVLLSAVGTVEASVAWDAALGRLTLTPAAPLALAVRYVAVASAPGGDLTWSFRTTDGAWLPEEEVGRGGDLALAVSADGHGLLGFHAGGEVHLRRFTLEGGLASSDDLLTDGPIVPLSLRLGVAEGGAALAVWGTVERTVRGRRGTLDGGWGPSPDIGGLGTPELVEDLALASDGTGVVLTSARSRVVQPGVLRAIPIGPDGFGAPSVLSTPTSLDSVRAAVQRGGRSWAAWSSWDSTGRVLGRHAYDAGAFGAELVLREPAARAGFVAMNHDDSLFVIWEEGSPLDAVKADRFTPQGESEGPVALDTAFPGSSSSGFYVRVAADHLGRAMALWVNEGSSDGRGFHDIRAQRYDAGWAPEHVALTGLTVEEWAVISPMGLVLDPHGNGFAGFGHGNPAVAWVSRFQEASGWGPAVELAGSATAPLVAVTASGRAAVAWASGGRVYLRRFIELTAPRPRH